MLPCGRSSLPGAETLPDLRLTAARGRQRSAGAPPAPDRGPSRRRGMRRTRSADTRLLHPGPVVAGVKPRGDRSRYPASRSCSALLRKARGLVVAPCGWLAGRRRNTALSDLSAHDPGGGSPAAHENPPHGSEAPCRAGVEVGCRMVPLSPCLSGPRRCQAPRTVASRPRHSTRRIFFVVSASPPCAESEGWLIRSGPGTWWSRSLVSGASSI
jgi:hypothetical protein